MKYDPIMCMMVDDSVKMNDELSLAQKKQVVTELKGFLKKSYNFSDESEYARAYEDLRQMFTTGSRKSISGLFENTVKKTGAHDSIETEDASWKAWSLYIDGKFVKSFNSEMPPIKEAKEYMKENHPGKVAKLSRNTGSASGYVISSKDSKTIDRAIRMTDGMFSSIFGKYSSAAKQHYDRAVKELDSFKGEIKDYLTLAGKWEMQIRNDLTRIDEAYNVAGNDYYEARREIKETMDSLTQVMLRKAREKQK